MSIVTIGIDLAKNVFAVHGVNEAGKPDLAACATDDERTFGGGQKEELRHRRASSR